MTGVAAVALLSLAACRTSGATLAPDPDQGLSVTGSGEAVGVPDEATITLGVTEHRADAASATAAASKTTEAIVTALIAAGVERSNIRTRRVSVYENRRYEPMPLPRGGEVEGRGERIEYVASNMLEVRVTDLDAIGKVLGAASRAGVNQMHGIEMKVGDPTRLEQAALDDAMAKARANAQRLAKASGVELGEVVAIRVGDAGGPGIRTHLSARGMDAAEESSVPIERGDITVRQSVWIKYAIR